MKKHLVILIGLVLLMGLGVFTTMKSRFPFHLSDIIQFVTIFVLFGFAMVSQIRLLISAKRGLPARDELSKKIWQKASSAAYFITIYYLIALWLISEQIKIDIGVIFQLALLGMAVILAVCWGVISVIGMKNEQ